MTRRFLWAAALVFGCAAAVRSDVRGDTLAGTWTADGGEWQVTIAEDGTGRVSVTTVSGSGERVTWSGTGRVRGRVLPFSIAGTRGLVHALGDAGAAPDGAGALALDPGAGCGTARAWWRLPGSETVERASLSRAASVAMNVARANLVTSRIDALMRGTTRSDDEREVVALLAGLPPLERWLALRRIDSGADKYDLDHLVFDDLDDGGRRRRALALMDEAGAAAARAGLLELGVVSDIDDTAVPHVFVKDGSVAFPGARDLYELLEGRVPGDIHYVTARPPLVLGDARGRLERAGLPSGTIHSGDLFGAVFGGLDGIEKEKVRDVERVLELHPHQRFVLLGDDRQRDPEVYREVKRRHPGRIEAVLIHRAGGTRRDEGAYPGQFFFDDYCEALKTMSPR